MSAAAAPSARVALVGNKNSGKSALFNALTGLKVHVGNYPGVTTQVESAPFKSELLGAGKASALEDVQLMDMPGLLSLNAYGPEEEDALAALLGPDAPDLILNVVDAVKLEPGLYLTLQLLELEIPVVVALNLMNDGGEAFSVNTQLLSELLGVPVVPVSATKGQGVGELASVLAKTLLKPLQHRNYDFCSGGLHKAIHAISHIVEEPAQAAGLGVRHVAARLIARDPQLPQSIGIPQADQHIIEHIISDLEAAQGQAGETILATARYDYVDQLCLKCVSRRAASKEQERSDRIDAYLTHKIWGIPIFLGIMALVFWLTFSVIGGPLQSALEWLFEVVGAWVGERMLQSGVAYWLYDLVINGAWAGVSSVLSFLPIIMVLFFFLSLLEDSGYMTRVSFVMDKLLRKIGISGRSLAPLLVGFGCNVPAIMATRSLPSERDRKLTVLLTPFMSCSAKLPVYAMITGAFFGAKAPLAMVSLYLLGIMVALVLGLILSKTIFKGDAMMYIMELPAYRLPALSDVLRHMWDNAAEFVRKAFTIIFLGTVLIWFLQNFDLSFAPVASADASILAYIGGKLSFLFAPLGLDNWQATTALLAGLVAKEAIVSTLAVLLSGGAETVLAASLAGIFTPLTAYTFLVFVLLYVPCVATFAATRRELGSTAQALGAVAMQLLVAFVIAFCFYNVGLLLGF